MNDAFQETLAFLRSQSGLTQEEVAHHLGITKAAVSKWECGQSMPDIALLPAIAELYAVTIDELFGRNEGPSQDEVDAIYLKALQLLAEDATVGIEFAREQARMHWSSAPLLRKLGLALFAQVPLLPGYAGTSLEGEALGCAQEIERLFRRVIELDPTGVSMQADLAPLVRVLLWTERSNEAEELIGSHVSKEPNLSAISLAQIYQESGRPDEAEVVLQRGLLLSLLEAEATMAAMAPKAKEDHLEALATLAEALQSEAAYVSLFPTLMPTLRLEQARRLAAAGKGDQAISALTAFADALDAACDAMLHPQNPSLFDKVADMLWREPDGQADSARADAVYGLRAAYANTFINEEIWDSVREGRRFKEALCRISNQSE